jgi:tRNA A37 N6-isopentenylltransferase MiaA
MKRCLINDEMLESVRECIVLGMSYSATSAALNISEDTFYSYMRKGREGKHPYCLFFQAVRESEAQLMKDCLTRLKKVADMGNMESIKFILERRFPKDWSKAENFNINAKSESVNVHVNPELKQSEADKLRSSILARLTPRNINSEIKQLRNSSQE